MGSAEIEAARKELNAVLASGIFDRSPTLSAMLQYVCEKCFTGEADQLKEYDIAINAFGRRPDFDNKRDSIVRVDAHRLRKRLREYYSGDGADHSVHIEIPTGAYAPRFIWRQVAAIPEPTQLIASGRLGIRLMERWSMLIAVVLIVASLAAIWYVSMGSKLLSRMAVASTVPPVTGVEAGDTVRLVAGSGSRHYVDSAGRVWSEDRYFTDGDEASVPFRTFARTTDPTIFLRRREGSFKYDIPLKPGVYEMRLWFAESVYGEGNVEGGGETSRLFSVLANGKNILEFFDVISDAGAPNTADVRVFKDIRPAADGYLHLQFVGKKSRAFVNAIEIVPGMPGRLLPIRFVARATGYTDSKHQTWMPEMYVAGGRMVLRQGEVTGTPDPELYQSEHYGNFSYAIPVAPGSYTLVLHLSETWHGPDRPGGGGVGSRLFDIFCNRTTLVQDFDVFKEAGGGYKALQKKFPGLHPNAQGKLMLSFVPVKNYACVNAVEVVNEGR